jgi:hypothetical protein
VFLHNLPHSRFGFAEGIFYFTIKPTSYKNLHADIAGELFQYAMIIFMFFTLNALLSVSDPYTISDDKGLQVMQGLW